MLTLKEASEKIGVSMESICTSKKYKPYYKRADAGKRNAFFDLVGYLKSEDTNEELVEKTKLFIEYIRHEKNVSYRKIAEISKVDARHIHSLSFGYETALKIATAFKPKYLLIRMFDEYYDFRVHKVNRSINFKSIKRIV